MKYFLWLNKDNRLMKFSLKEVKTNMIKINNNNLIDKKSMTHSLSWRAIDLYFPINNLQNRPTNFKKVNIINTISVNMDNAINYTGSFFSILDAWIQLVIGWNYIDIDDSNVNVRDNVIYFNIWKIEHFENIDLNNSSVVIRVMLDRNYEDEVSGINTNDILVNSSVLEEYLK